jgi:hypothetical protein
LIVLCVYFVDRCLSFCTFSLGHCVVCSSSIYGFWLHLWYLQTLLIIHEFLIKITDHHHPHYHVNLVTNPVISHQWEKDREVFTTSGPYPWSFVTQIFHNGQPSHGGDRDFTTKEMISIFPLWTFHLHVATFQQHLHMEYISLRWYDIPELVVPIRITLIEGCC